MTPDSLRADYRRLFAGRAEDISIRRYTGQGPNRPVFDWGPVAAVVRGYGPAELVGDIQQGDRHVILLWEDVVGTGFPLPFKSNDQLVIDGTPMTIQAPDDATRRVAGHIIAYEFRVRGP